VLPARRRLIEHQEMLASMDAVGGLALAAEEAAAGAVEEEVEAGFYGQEEGDARAMGAVRHQQQYQQQQQQQQQQQEGESGAGTNAAWLAFGGTEAGRMLAKLYKGRDKPQIAYPPVRVGPPRAPGAAFIPGGGSAEADPRATRGPKPAVRVPQPARARPPPVAPIDAVPSRKHAASIAAEGAARLRDAALDGEAPGQYRPPARKPTSTDAEKRRLQAQFQFKGGSILPAHALAAPIAGHVPLASLVDPSSGAAALAAARRAEERDGAAAAGRREAASGEALFGKIFAEIEAREAFLVRAREAGEGRRWEAQIQGEIAERVRELERVDALMRGGHLA
jgi:hypothetical protein